MKRQRKVHNEIDYDTLIYDSVVQNIRFMETWSGPGLVEAWVVEIPTTESARLVKHMKDDFPQDEALRHLKRFVKTERGSLRTLICSVSLLSREDLDTKLEGISVVGVEKVNVPGNYPKTKEDCDEYSKEYWPISWKGNPVIQELNELRVDVDTVRDNLARVCEESRKAGNVVTMFVNPLRPEERVIKSRGDKLSHSIMRCIQQIADDELERRARGQRQDTDYLCLGYDVYTTHEPCAMCAMALVHSRVSNLFFVKPNRETGAICPDSGAGYCMHRSLTLNWKFEAWRWLEHFDTCDLPPCTFV